MSLCYLSSFIVVSRTFYKDPGLPLVCVTIGSSIGQFAFPALFEVLISKFSWSGAFIIVSGVTLHCFPFGLLISLSRDYYATGEDAIDNKNISSKCDNFVSLLTDVLVCIILINCLLLALTGKKSLSVGKSFFLVRKNRGILMSFGNVLK